MDANEGRDCGLSSNLLPARTAAMWREALERDGGIGRSSTRYAASESGSSLASELQHQISAIVSDIEQDKLVPDFDVQRFHPRIFISLTACSPARFSWSMARHLTSPKAIREEWKAREQRAINGPAGKPGDGSHHQRLRSRARGTLVRSPHSDGWRNRAEAWITKGNVNPVLKILRWTHEKHQCGEADRTGLERAPTMSAEAIRCSRST